MKLPPFGYLAPTGVEEAVEVLTRFGPNAAVLAGGQSLLLQMRLLERSPAVLVGLEAVPGLSAVQAAPTHLELGALVRHAALEARSSHALVPLGTGSGGAARPDPLVRLLALVAPQVAHPPIRARGTFVGSLAWAHPSAEWCALAALVRAVVLVRGPGGGRQVEIQDWFRGGQRTDLRSGELVTGVRLPRLPAGTGVGFVEHRRSHASFALVAALAAVRSAEDGTIASARVGLAGAGDRPVAADLPALVGHRPGPQDLAAAAAELADGCEPVAEPHCSAEYRRHCVQVLTRRAIEQALADANPAGAGRRSG